MPIGLPDGPERRACDEAARKILGSKAASRVFFAPPRPIIDAPDYAEFSRRHREFTGQGASKQLWNILPKIREVDAALSPELQRRVFEFHPELVWRRLSDTGQALASKHTASGLLERMGLMAEAVPGLYGLAETPVAKRAKLDDVLDALAGLSAAEGFASSPPETSRRLPEGEPPLDARGLRMEIWG
jgi:predicted RNase H-like nuclease